MFYYVLYNFASKQTNYFYEVSFIVLYTNGHTIRIWL